jgi:S1-C subfamily serine protease
MHATILGTLAALLTFGSVGTASLSRFDENKDAKGDQQVKELGDVKAPTVKAGAVIVDVTEGGPATKGSLDKEGTMQAGLEKGDTIVKVDGKEIKSAKDYHDSMKGDEQKELTVVDQKTGQEVKAYFKPSKGALGIKFYIIPQK